MDSMSAVTIVFLLFLEFEIILKKGNQMRPIRCQMSVDLR